jgi:hypothetical protein
MTINVNAVVDYSIDYRFRFVNCFRNICIKEIYVVVHYSFYGFQLPTTWILKRKLSSTVYVFQPFCASVSVKEKLTRKTAVKIAKSNLITLILTSGLIKWIYFSYDIG